MAILLALELVMPHSFIALDCLVRYCKARGATCLEKSYLKCLPTRHQFCVCQCIDGYMFNGIKCSYIQPATQQTVKSTSVSSNANMKQPHTVNNSSILNMSLLIGIPSGLILFTFIILTLWYWEKRRRLNLHNESTVATSSFGRSQRRVDGAHTQNEYHSMPNRNANEPRVQHRPTHLDMNENSDGSLERTHVFLPANFYHSSQFNRHSSSEVMSPLIHMATINVGVDTVNDNTVFNELNGVASSLSQGYREVFPESEENRSNYNYNEATSDDYAKLKINNNEN